ncbi:unnamed protein product [Linum tenue]|uniref:Pentatricopeptide repeat-containing protein n=1 Tax=Linum tenue TaxID=586396 RepID=A0AAV0NI60_9ROSI|nr:unnamed protein product [Linum tenue]
MLFSLRSLFHVRLRSSHRLWFTSHPLLLNNYNNHIRFLVPHSPNVSLISCPCIWFAGFLCILRLPFATRTVSTNSDVVIGELDRDSVSKIVQQGCWDDPRIVGLVGSSSSLAPLRVSRVLLVLRHDPRLALKFFNWAKTLIGFRHTTESYCLLAHILFYGRMYFDANDILKELVLAGRSLPGFDVFEVLWSTRNVCVSGYGVFDALFSVYIELGMLEKADNCFSRMRSCRVLPKARSCNALLHRLAKGGKKEDGAIRNFFRNMVGAGISPSVFTYNIMIDHVCKEGDIEAAKSLFEEMKHKGVMPDVVTYNSLIDGYGKLGFLENSVGLFEEMKQASCEPDAVTYNALINCFCKFDRIARAFQFFSEMKHNGVRPSVITYSTLVDALCKEGMMQQAIKFFIDMKRLGYSPNEYTMLNASVAPNLKTYTALAHGYIKGKSKEDYIEFLKQIKMKGFQPDLMLFGTIIWGLCTERKFEECKLVMFEMKQQGIGANPVIYTTLVDAYFKAGMTAEALDLVREMWDSGAEATVVTFCVLIDGLCKKGMVQEAIDYFTTMPDYGLQPNVAVYTALVDGLCKNNFIEAAVTLFNEMQEKHMIPDKTAYTTLIDGYLKHGSLQEALNTRNKMVQLGLQLDLHAYTALVSGCARCGNLQQARIFLTEMIDNGIFPDRMLCDSLLKKYYEQGLTVEAIELQNDLAKKGLIDGSYDCVVPEV